MKKLFLAHKILSTLVSLIIIFIIVICGMRFYNKHIKDKAEGAVSGASAALDEIEEDVDAVSVTIDQLGYGITNANEVIDREGNLIGYVNGNKVVDANGEPVMTEDGLPIVLPEPEATEEPTPEPTKDPASDKESDLNATGKERREQIAGEEQRREELEQRKVEEAEKKRIEEAIKNMDPVFGDKTKCWGKDGVPDKMVDGSSCKDYYKQVDLSDFGSNWGKQLTKKDKVSERKFLIGVDQNPSDEESGYSCESLGWLIDHLDVMKANDCIKFTDLNIIGKLSKSHVAVLCSYDWYSVFGLKDTMVVFEDISNRLSTKKYKAGTIFSAVVYRHNIKVKKVNGYRVVCVQYATFSGKAKKHKKVTDYDDPTAGITWSH